MIWPDDDRLPEQRDAQPDLRADHGGVERPVRRSGSGANRQEAEASLAAAVELAAAGPPRGRGGIPRAIELAWTDLTSCRATSSALAEALDGWATRIGRRPAREAETFREAVALRDRWRPRPPTRTDYRDLAVAREGLGRALAEAGRTAEAIERARPGSRPVESLAADHPADPSSASTARRPERPGLAALPTEPDPGLRDASAAVRLAEEAVREASRPTGLLEHPGRGPLPGRRLGRGDRGPGAVGLDRPGRAGPPSTTSSWPWPGPTSATDRAREWFEAGERLGRTPSSGPSRPGPVPRRSGASWMRRRPVVRINFRAKFPEIYC